MSVAIQVKEVLSEESQSTVRSEAPNLSLAPHAEKSEAVTTPAERLKAMNRERNLKSLQYILNSLPDAETRFYPFFDEAAVKINWRKLFMQDWTEDERLTLQWLRTMWTGKMYVKPRWCGGLLPIDYELKEAILCAFTTENYVSFIIDSHYREKHSRKRSSRVTED